MSTQIYGTNAKVSASPLLLAETGPKDELPESLTAVVERLESAQATELVRRCFTALLGLLADLRNIGAGEAIDEFRHDPSAVASLEDGVMALIEYIEEVSAECDGLKQDVEEALIGVGFALRHEVRRAIEFDLSNLDDDGHSDAYQSKVAHAYNLLRNCFQQCIVLLARSIDPDFDDRGLCDDAGSRLEQSIRLRDALISLLDSVKDAEGGRYPQSALAVIDEVEAFRRDHMRHLMRRDWETFDSFVNEIVSAREQKEFTPATKKFLTYLETLLAHVQMRSVLKEPPATAAAHMQSRAALKLLSRAARKPAAWAAAAASVVLTCGFIFSSRLNAEGAAARRDVSAVNTVAMNTAPANAVSANSAGVRQDAGQTAAPVVAPSKVKAKAPAVAPSKTGEGSLTVQVGAYRDLALANSATAGLAAKGVEARVLKASAPGQGVVFRVQVGRFSTREEASRFGGQLKAKGAVRAYLIAEAE